MSDFDDLFLEDQEYVLNLPNHLSKAGMVDDLCEILMEFEFINYKVLKKDCQSLLQDYSLSLAFNFTNNKNEILKIVQDAIQLSRYFIEQDQTQLAGQLLGRLQCFEKLEIKQILKDAIRSKATSWLRPLKASLVTPISPIKPILITVQLGLRSIDITPDEHWAICGDNNGLLYLWDLNSRIQNSILIGHPSSVITSIAITPDGLWAVSGSTDGTIRYWNLKTNTQKYVFIHNNLKKDIENNKKSLFKPPFMKDNVVFDYDFIDFDDEISKFIENTIQAVAITVDGACAVSASGDGVIKFWDLTTGSKKLCLFDYSKKLNALALSSNGIQILFNSFNQIIYFKYFDLDNKSEVFYLDGHINEVTALDITTDGKWGISGCVDGIIKLWNLENCSEITTLIGHQSPINSIKITTDGQWGISCSDDWTIKVWDLKSSTEKLSISDFHFVEDIALSPNGHCLVSISANGNLKKWDLDSVLKNIKNSYSSLYSEKIFCIELTSESEKILCGFENGLIKECNLTDDYDQIVLGNHSDAVIDLAVSTNGKYAISSSRDSIVKIWDLEKKIELFVEKISQDKQSVAITAEGNFAFYTSFNEIKIWNLFEGIEQHILKGHTNTINSIKVTPDGNYLISSDKNYTLKLWNLKKKGEQITLTDYSNIITCMAITPSGEKALIGTVDGTIKIYDFANEKQISLIGGHKNFVTSVKIMPNGKTAISTSEDKMLKVWDLTSQKEIASFCVDYALSQCAFYSNFSKIIALDISGNLHLFKLEIID